MKLNLGTIRSNCSGFNAIADVAVKTKDVWFDSIELDLSSCSFFEANMAAPLYAVISRLRDDLNDVSISNLPSGVSTILRKNKFLSVFNQPELTDTNQTTLPFKILKLTAGDQFNDYLDTYMRGRGIPTMSEALTKRFRQSLFEIFLNATIHSQSKAGIFVCGQFYPNKHRLDFTIADAGVGIRENVRQYTKMPKLNSCKAIEWAMAEGNTTKTGNQPGGLGLKLIKDFIQINGGKIQVVSRFGYYEFSANGEFVRKMDNDFPGTCVNIEINTEDTSSYCLKAELKSEDIF
ncbi:ATP-binding protein [Nitrosomonas communis]|uniref:ATP-binding protein n=1 Tax=Nitrosomonas communis TaxID=44574 RepID=UPI0026F16E20|nr:ATP-binding protein [Nitrosomonas communis]MCO6428555.1 ATP-binding protein [Nitrosomonas communis]